MKKQGTLINSIKGIKVKLEIVNGTGRGDGKEYINLSFTDKPSDTVRESMKKHHFKFFKLNNTWSAYNSEKALNFAYSLIKENNIKSETIEVEKPQKTSRGASKKSTPKADNSLEARVQALEKGQEEQKDILLKILAKLG